ncbi:1641_t:CDS:2 [Ambispora gerdemannii]|uniref:1641_t:CDS:1 n=1 Tax=Ambispora gerdemannii TaxID=144530 RepID=A0A9N9DTQ0_9GLOM|nr:1641_t:CDS:2 [Ambispora gerdemannii]
MIERLQIPLIDADKIAREVVEPGKPAYKQIIKHFSRDILLEDNTIDRVKLGNIIFANESKRKVLNRCTHPYIHLTIVKSLMWYWLIGERMTVLDVPLLIEGGFHKYLSAVIVVYCDPRHPRSSEQLQLTRLIKRDNLSEHAARQRMAVQIPLSEKVNYADYVIDNSGELQETERQVIRVMKKVRPKLWNWLAAWVGPPVAFGVIAMALFPK